MARTKTGRYVLAFSALAALGGTAGGDEPAKPAAPAAPSRADLAIPDDVWGKALEGVGRAGGVLGYTGDEMRNYGRDAHVNRVVQNLFRDVRAVPRFSGKVTDDLLAAVKDPATADPSEIVRMAWTLSDVAAGRNLDRPKGTSWGVLWLSDGVKPVDALGKVVARMGEGAGGGTIPLGEPAEKAWKALPVEVQRFVVRFLVGAAEAAPWIRGAFDEAFLVAATKAPTAEDLTFTRLYRLATAPWKDEELDQAATFSHASFEALGKTGREALAYGSVVFLIHANAALAEWRAWAGKATLVADLVKAQLAEFRFETPLGAVRVFGPADDTIASGADSTLLTLDVGGDDTWKGRHGVPGSVRTPISVFVDLAGNDKYESADAVASFGCGLFGFGAGLDLAGNDSYTVKESGLGCAWHGTGLLWDEAGDDTYVVKEAWGQGAAHVGAGVLVDLAGKDSYECAMESQGLGGTLGTGLLLDLAGDDAYVARDDGNKEKIYLDQSVAMAQGCGFGRRADLGDGRSLAGGVGVLLDGAGNDRYHAQVWAQGVAYWWSLGILEDRGGNDVYENGKYSLGAGAHFGIGCQVDLAGDDLYNQGVTTAVDQYQGHARDGSIGVSVDGDGNDKYRFRNLCGGSGDLCSIGLFWDRRGDDVYEVVWNDLGPDNGWNETPPFGSATTGEPMRSFRDELSTYGVFLDTGGRDAYTWDKTARQEARDDHVWTRKNGPRSFGVGIDSGSVPAREPGR